MHLGGAPGCGKTYIGKQIKSKYNNLKVIDTDMLKDKFIEKPIEENMKLMEQLTNFSATGKKTKKQKELEKKYEENYKNYVVNKFKKLHKQKQKYLLVGHFFMFDDYMINVDSKHKIYMDIDKDTLFKRRNSRLVKDIVKNKNYFIELVNEGEEFWNYNYLWKFTGMKELGKELVKSKSYYNKYKFKNLVAEEIFKLVDKEMK